MIMNFRNLFKIHISFGDTEEKIEKVKKLQKGVVTGKVDPSDIPKVIKIKHLNNAKKIKIRQLHRKGFKTRDIASQLHVAPSTVSYWIHISYKSVPSKRKLQREAYQKDRPKIIMIRHQKLLRQGKTLKNHSDCPVCFPKTSKISLDTYIARNRKINYSQIVYAKSHKKKKMHKLIVEEETVAVDFTVHDRPLQEEYQMLQRPPEKVKKFCFYPSCTDEATDFVESTKPMCARHFQMYKEFKNI